MSAHIRVLFFLFPFTAFLAILSACKNAPSVSDNTGPVKTPVTIIPVAFKPAASTIELPATSRFMNKNIVRAGTSGTIEDILVRQGENVTSGQLLLTIRTREAMALGNIAGNDSSLYLKGLIRVTSHKAGIINSIEYQKGDLVQEGDAIAVIYEQKSLVFIMDVPFEYQSIADKNRECTVLLPDRRKIRGIITGKLPDMEIQSQTVSYIIKPEGADQLPANLIARVILVRSSNDNACVLPKDAVLSNETQNEFWVMKVMNDSTAVKVHIRKGYENNDEIEIIEPSFNTSDRIVLKGNYGLPDTAGISISREE